MSPAQTPKNKDRGWIIPIGGGDRKVNTSTILQRLVELSGGADARMVIIPTASQLDTAGQRTRDVFRELGVSDIEIVDILDTNPFVDPMVVVEASGAQIRAALEQSFTHLRGLMQVSRLKTTYDTSKPQGQRLVSVTHKGKELNDTQQYEVCMSGIISRGGDHYDVFKGIKIVREYDPLGDMTIAYFRKHGTILTPAAGRQKDLALE